MSSDSVRLLAVPANPLVPVDTKAVDSFGTPGIRIGDTTYAQGPGSTVKEYFLVVVLDRATLGRVSTWTWTDATALHDFLRGLDDSKLVIAVLEGSGAGLARDSLERALGPIGFKFPDGTPGGSFRGGSVSTIAVPGMSPGEANVNVDEQAAAK